MSQQHHHLDMVKQQEATGHRQGGQVETPPPPPRPRSTDCRFHRPLPRTLRRGLPARHRRWHRARRHTRFTTLAASLQSKNTTAIQVFFSLSDTKYFK